MKRLAMVAFACLAGIAFGDVIDVGFRDRREIKVDAGQTCEQTNRVTVDAHGLLSKTGDGALRLSRKAFVQHTAR